MVGNQARGDRRWARIPVRLLRHLPPTTSTALTRPVIAVSVDQRELCGNDRRCPSPAVIVESPARDIAVRFGRVAARHDFQL